jgi:DUF1680 family protein
MKMKLNNTSLKNIRIDDAFWNRYIGLVRNVILPYQWEMINDRVEGATKSHCIHNFRVAAGLEEGKHEGAVFQDTDLAKWLEAVSYVLASQRDPHLEELADGAIELIAAAQCDDGYLDTYYTITGEPRWSDLFEGHELYTAGHMIEAAVAYYQATGKRRFLDIVCRMADNIAGVFGAEDGKCHGYPGHPEIELALVKLYHVTGEKRYLKLADYFVRQRGARPCYFLNEKAKRENNYIFPEFRDFEMDYCQAHLPIREQKTAEGHAVRAVYLYSAMADIASECQDEDLLRQCDELWSNITEKRMYVTGSIGSASYGERFTTDYDLPNDTNYSESCATIGLAMFSNRMFQITRNGKYSDVMERALYNTLLAGIAADGKHFFYVNPLEVVPEVAEKNPTMSHVKTTRQAWFGVACCPPNIARTLASLGNYIYSVDRNAVFVNLFIGSTIEAPLESGKATLSLRSEYPARGDVRILVHPEAAGQTFTIAVRKPAFSPTAGLTVNGQTVSATLKDGYLYVSREWHDGDEIALSLDVSFRFVHCNPRVRENIGKVCLMKGPWVYCLEEADNGKYLASARIDTAKLVREMTDDSLPGTPVCAELSGDRIDYDAAPDALYSAEKAKYQPGVFKAVPYCCWNNRGKGEMIVWMREKETVSPAD